MAQTLKILSDFEVNDLLVVEESYVLVNGGEYLHLILEKNVHKKEVHYTLSSATKNEIFVWEIDGDTPIEKGHWLDFVIRNGKKIWSRNEVVV